VQQLQGIEVFDTKPGHPQPPPALEDNSPAFLSAMLLFSFCAYPSFPQRNFALGSPSNDDRQLGRPTASPLLSLLKRILLFQSRSLLAADCL